ncbi:MAG: GAF domain-containing protein [Sphingomonas bacterium]|nr:GAF domain-containing protein [Sphingomonas bacterium]
MTDLAPPQAPGQDRVQPCGFLLGLSDEWLILHASANIGEFLGADAGELIGRQAGDHICVEAIHSLRNRLALLRGPDAVERLFRCALLGDDRLFDLAIHRSGDTIILEGQPSSGKHYGDVTATVSGMMSRLDGASDLAALLDAGARQIRALTGFDRVSIVRLPGNSPGSIIAECTRATIASTIGEACDADTAAREQYRRRRLHVIADTAALPVALLSDRHLAAAPLDLSLAMLGAASPRRIASLRAREVGAAMMLSLIIDGKLWGIIDCQHHFARAPSFERRSMADLFTQMFAMRIEICELRNPRN